MGKLVSDLLAQALRARHAARAQDIPIQWIVRDMGARIDLRDRDALEEALDQPDERETELT